MTKFRAVWEDNSSDTESSVHSASEDAENRPSPQRRPPVGRLDKGKGRATPTPSQSSSSEREDEDDDMYANDDQDIAPPPSSKALVPSAQGEFIYPHETRRATTASTRETTMESMDDVEGDSDKENKVSIPTKRKQPPSEPIPWPAQVGVEPHRVHVMQQSFFHTDSSRSKLQLHDQTTTTPRLGSSSFLKPLAEQQPPRNFTTPRPPPSQIAQSSTLHPSTETTKFKKIPASSPFSVIAKQEGRKDDMRFGLGRSFRVSWGPSGTLCLIGMRGKREETQDQEDISPTAVTIQKLQFSPHSPESERTVSNNLLATLSSHTTISHTSAAATLKEPQAPQAILNGELRWSSFLSGEGDERERALWKLGSALFDPLPSTDEEEEDDGESTRDYRLERLSTWLSDSVRAEVERDLRTLTPTTSTDPQEKAAQKVFILLSGYQLQRAVSLALDSSLNILALLISQCGPFASPTMRAEVEEQLKLWQEDDAKWIRKCWELVAGRFVDIKQGSWKRALGMRLWFGAVASSANLEDRMDQDGDEDVDDDRLSSVLREYEELWRSGKAPRPSPPSPRQIPASSSEVMDAPYLLLRLFSSSKGRTSLPGIDHPLSYSSSPYDFRLPFFVSLLLSRGGSGEVKVKDSLVEAYAALLENVSAIREAVFVLLFLSHPTGRRKAITELLSRNAKLLVDEEGQGLNDEGETLQQSLTEVLRIPLPWVCEAKATCHLYLNQHFLAYSELLDCPDSQDLQNIAHDIACYWLAPEVVLRGDMRLLRWIFSRFKGVDGWAVRGKLYLDYAELIMRLDALAEANQEDSRPAVPDAVEQSELARLALELPKLIPLIPDLGGMETGKQGLAQRVALELMSNELARRGGELEASLGMDVGLGLGRSLEKGKGRETIILGKPIGLGVDDSVRLEQIKDKVYRGFVNSLL